MREMDAVDMLCPQKICSFTYEKYENGQLNCEPGNCMAWEEWTEPIWEFTDSGVKNKVIGLRPKDPPQGHCGMVPPELNCNN